MAAKFKKKMGIVVRSNHASLNINSETPPQASVQPHKFRFKLCSGSY